jgi:hypothetical protein
MRTLDSHPLFMQAYQLMQTIESLGASPALTAAVSEAALLKSAIGAHLDSLDTARSARRDAIVARSEASVRARFVAQRISQLAGGHTEVSMQAVYGMGDGNKDFADATPQGQLTMMINPGRKAAGFFKPGKAYLLDFVEEPQQLPVA